jgi:hypothetical protein
MKVCLWIVDELRFIGKENCARCLERYWRDHEADALVELLDYAQFPDEMSDQ